MKLKQLDAIILFLVCLFAGQAGEAKLFQNSYVSFQLPDQWDCQLEQTEYVCKNKAPGQDQREAVIILTAKEQGAADNLPAYQGYLKNPKSIASPTGQPIVSEVKQVDIRTINNQEWVDGLHLSSQIPSYYTRYLATVRDRIGMVVTFSAHKRFYAKYSEDFLRAINSLNVLTTKGLAAGNGNGITPGGDLLGANINPNLAMDGYINDEEGGKSGDGGDSNNNLIFGGAAIIGAVGIYLLIKMRS